MDPSACVCVQRGAVGSYPSGQYGICSNLFAECFTPAARASTARQQTRQRLQELQSVRRHRKRQRDQRRLQVPVHPCNISTENNWSWSNLNWLNTMKNLSDTFFSPSFFFICLTVGKPRKGTSSFLLPPHRPWESRKWRISGELTGDFIWTCYKKGLR